VEAALLDLFTIAVPEKTTSLIWRVLDEIFLSFIPQSS